MAEVFKHVILKYATETNNDGLLSSTDRALRSLFRFIFVSCALFLGYFANTPRFITVFSKQGKLLNYLNG